MRERNKIGKIYNKIDKIAITGGNYITEYYKLIDEIIDKGEYSYFESCLLEYYKIDISKIDSTQDVKHSTWSKILILTNTSFSKRLKKLYDSKDSYQIGYDIYTNSYNTLLVDISNALTSTYSIASTTQSIAVSVNDNKFSINIDDINVYRVDIFKCDWSLIENIDQPLQKSLELINQLTIGTQSWYDIDIYVYGHEYLLKTYSKVDNFNYKLTITENKYLGKIIEKEEYTIESKYYVKNKQLAKLYNTVRTNLEVEKIGTYSILITDNDPSLNEDQNLLIRYGIAIDYLLNESVVLYMDDYVDDYSI